MAQTKMTGISIRIVLATLLMGLLSLASVSGAAAQQNQPSTTEAAGGQAGNSVDEGGSLVPTPSAADRADCSANFSDVHPADWYYGPVLSLACKGIISGYADNTFRPGNSVTRGQVAKMVVVALGWSLVSANSSHFTDVARGSTYFNYVETAATKSVIAGYADGTFRPGANVTRAQLTKIIVMAQGWTACGSCSQHFSDVSPSNPFFGFVEAAVAKQAISGYADGSFRPGNSATRAQFSSVLSAVLNHGVSVSGLTSEEQATIDLINSRRAAQGLGRLAVNMALVTASRRQSSDIGPRALCQHNGTDGSSPWSRAADAGYTGSPAGETIGCAYFTPDSVVGGWWDSPAHHDILTNPTINEIGCGWWLSAPAGAGWQTCVTGTHR